MPGFNGMGPQDMGSMTGRGRGFCISYAAPGAGYTSGFGRCGGRGWRHWYHATGLPRWARWTAPAGGEQELGSLKEQVSILESALEQLKKRIQDSIDKE